MAQLGKIGANGAARLGATLALALGAAACASLNGPPGSLPPAPGPGEAPAPLHVDCRGAPGPAPTVILEAGAFGTSADWTLVLKDLAPGGRVCAYDRAGVGLSAPRPGGVGVLDRARELAGLLDQIGETRPVIVVGHSNGALYAEAFARLYPERTAGLVYVNGVGSDDLGHRRLMASLAEERRLSDLAVSVARLGLAPLVAATLTDGQGFERAAEARKRAGLECLPCLVVARDEDRAIVAGLSEVRALPPVPPSVPVVVIAGDTDPDLPLPRAWMAAEVAPAARAQTSWILDAPDFTHVSPLARDRAYVDAAVAWLRRPYGG